MPLRDYITEMVTIQEASEDGKRWTIKVDVPSMRSKYPIGPLWKDYVDGERIHKGDQVNVKIVRGKLKKAGSYEDADFGYFWELAEWDTDAPPQSVANGQVVKTLESQDDRDTRIAWNSSINNAVHLVGTDNRVLDDPELLRYEIVLRATIIYDLITAGPPQAEPPPDWQDPRDGPQATETPRERSEVVDGSKLEPRPSKGSLAKLKQVNQARSDETISIDVLQNYVANQPQWKERDLRDLVDSELDEVIEAIIAGQVMPTISQPDGYDPDELPF